VVVAVSLTAQGCKKGAETPSPPTPAPAASQQPKPVQKQLSSAKGAKDGGAKAVPPPVQKQLSSARRGQPAMARPLDFSTKKDPFKPFIIAPQVATEKAAPLRSRRPAAEALPIQSFETDKFKVTGIIVGLKENSALIVDPTGKGYVIKEGMQIGPNEGYVTKITSTDIEVVEKFSNEKGHVKKRTVKLMLFRKTKESSR